VSTVAIDRLVVLLRKVNDESVRVTWFDQQSGDTEYEVAAPQLDAASAEVRKQLDAFVQAYIRDTKSAATAQAMKKLVDAGHDLFESLFMAVGDSAGAEAARERYLEAAASGTPSLSLKVDPPIAYPWALAVPTLPADDGAPLDPATLFWSLKHEVSISTFGAGLKRPAALGAAEYKTFAAMHKAVYDAVSASIDSSDEKQLIIDLEKRCEGGFAFQFDQFIKSLRNATADTQAKLRIAYLMGHASGDRFQLSATDEISAGTLAARLGDATNRMHRQQTFLFLNGCDTAAEGERFAFTGLLRYPNIAGIIGTEVRVPDRFAFRFALAFFTLVFVGGQTFRDALNILRRRHLPISLAYTLYASDSVSLAPPAGAPAAAASTENFSEGKVKCAP
jgi:hypothetical protein